MEVQCGSGEAFLDKTDASRWGCLGVWWWWAAVWAGFFLRPLSCWIWENPVLADGTLGFYSLWLFITGLFLVTGDRWVGSSACDSVQSLTVPACRCWDPCSAALSLWSVDAGTLLHCLVSG